MQQGEPCSLASARLVVCPVSRETGVCYIANPVRLSQRRLDVQGIIRVVGIPQIFVPGVIEANAVLVDHLARICVARVDALFQTRVGLKVDLERTFTAVILYRG